MANGHAPSGGCEPVGTEALSISKVLEALWDSAWEALVLAFLARILGGIVVGAVGGIWHEMTPSLPPGLGANPLELPQAAIHLAGGWFRQHLLALLFGVFFVAKIVARLTRGGGTQAPRGLHAAVGRICHRLSEEWFGLIVMNAFTAFVAVMVLQFTRHFSSVHWGWGVVCAMAQPLLQACSSLAPGVFAKLTAFYDWFGDNQLKFTFWLFYAGAICDDLGLPNYKALARWFWRRVRRRGQSSASEPGAADSGAQVDTAPRHEP
jgi:hypothetical protein